MRLAALAHKFMYWILYNRGICKTCIAQCMTRVLSCNVYAWNLYNDKHMDFNICRAHMSECQDAPPCISPPNSICKLYKARRLHNARDR